MLNGSLKGYLHKASASIHVRSTCHYNVHSGNFNLHCLKAHIYWIFSNIGHYEEDEVAKLGEVLRRKVAGSIHNCVVGICHWHNPSGRTMSPGSIQLLTEMSTRNISWKDWEGGGVLRCLVCRADNLATLICRLSWNLGASTSRKFLGLSRLVKSLL
jgi:hypothetical protein